MQVIINETKDVKDLTIIDDATGTEWTRDLLGNCNIHTDSDNFYHMDAADYVWWMGYITGYKATEQEIFALAEKAQKDPYQVRMEVFDYMGQNDMENERGRAIQKLEELAEEYGVEYARA